MEISLPNILHEESHYVKEIDAVVYIGAIVNRFESNIQALDCWYGKIQTVSFCEQELIFEADITKSEDEISIVHLYAMTDDMDVLDELEDMLTDKVERIIERLNCDAAQSVCQVGQIRQDQLQAVIF